VEPIFFESQADLRAWFEAHHADSDELLLGYWKKSAGNDGGVSYREAVDEALCWGWIDGVRRSIDEQRHAQRFTPRRKRSIWSNFNIARFQELEAAGRVTPAGREAFEARSPERSGVYSFEQGEIDLDEQMLAEFKQQEAAWAYWQRAPRSYRKPATWWVVSAKRDETKQKRLAQLIECSARGVKVPLLRRPGEPA
jgi:uncharacterized protein YdeI (YjbR/CyaY-like superfamily)